MSIPVIGPIMDVVGNLFGLGRDYLEGKRKLTQAKVEAQIALESLKVKGAEERATAGKLHEINWEMLMAKGTMSSLKDEWVLLMISIPFLSAAFGYPEIAERTFQAFDAAPDWYRYTFVTIALASFGIRAKDQLAGLLRRG